MTKTRTNKVVCYLVRDRMLLTFVHLGHPEAAGAQVPTGTIRPP